MEFILELVMLNTDVEYDVIVPIACVCKRLAAVVLPGEFVGNPLYGCLKLRGGALHGPLVRRFMRYQIVSHFECEKMVYGRRVLSFEWDSDDAMLNFGATYRDVSVVAYMHIEGFVVCDRRSGAITCDASFHKVKKNPAICGRNSGRVIRRVLGMEVEKFVDLL